MELLDDEAIIVERGQGSEGGGTDGLRGGKLVAISGVAFLGDLW
jgi:hypothetical protein